MKKILVLGGTKYVGLELIKLLNFEKIDYYVASRKQIFIKNYIFIDRKNIKDLDSLFSKHNFEIVIDFICFSSLDSKKLVDSLKLNNRKPKLIVISSTYVYSDPLKLSCDSTFDENSFKAKSHDYSLNDRPKINYIDGKKEMESYLIRHYFKDKLVVLRFPVILGHNDYTKRTQFYFDKLKNRLTFNSENLHNVTNYIFPYEACLSILNFINSNNYGTYNIASKAISELHLISIYCEYFKISVDDFLDYKLKKFKSPFYIIFDFKIDSSKYHSIFNSKVNLKKSLFRELSKIK